MYDKNSVHQFSCVIGSNYMEFYLQEIFRMLKVIRNEKYIHMVYGVVKKFFEEEKTGY